MNWKDNRTLAITAVIVVTLLLQIPGLDKWYGEIAGEHTHVITIAEGIFGLIMVLWGSSKTTPGVAK